LAIDLSFESKAKDELPSDPVELIFPMYPNPQILKQYCDAKLSPHFQVFRSAGSAGLLKHGYNNPKV
jgi:hypothetical protein